MTRPRTRSGLLAAALVAAAGCATTAGSGAGPPSAPAGSTAASDRVATPSSSTSAVPTATTGTTQTTAASTIAPSPSTTSTTTSAPTPTTAATTTPTTPSTTGAPTTTTTTVTTTTVPAPPTTACTDVAHVADSTGVYLWDAQYVDGAANTMGERYRSIGVERWIDDSSGGRSIRERHAAGQTNAVEAADAIRRGGFDGCWVIMMGTNDAANVAAGANLGLEERILGLLFVLGEDPVLWVDAATNRDQTVYRNENMRAWNDVLNRIAAERENVRVVRWSDQVRSEWFVSDGVHVGTEGRIWRAAIIAAALVDEFPA